MDKELARKIAVMQACADGKKIEFREPNIDGDPWKDCRVSPIWDWYVFDYRVKPAPPKSLWINEYATYHCVYKDKASAVASAASSALRVAVEYKEVVKG